MVNTAIKVRGIEREAREREREREQAKLEERSASLN
jgi:hypothetical protein